MRGRILVIGKGLLGKAVARHPQAADIEFLSHGAATDAGIFDGVDCVVNLGINPAYRSDPYRAEIDFDLHLASLLGDRPLHYVMVSSRKVYGMGGGMAFAEDAPLRPIDDYGRNKVRSEALLSNMLGDRLTVMRISNIVGFDWEWNRAIFFGLMLDSLRREDRIVFDVDPKVQRDFITDDAVAGALLWAAREAPPGVFNLGSGIPLEIGNIARWTLEAHGSGELVVTSTRKYDEFVLDVAKLSRCIGPPCTIELIRRKCFELGRHIAHA